MKTAIQMTLQATVVDSFARLKDDSTAIGTALQAPKLTLPVTRTTLLATWTNLPATETVFWKALNYLHVYQVLLNS
jgi:hypothetical protein